MKLDDAGRLDKFFDGEIKKINQKIANIDMNKAQAKLSYDKDLSELEGDIEDAQVQLDEAYTAITIDQISTNEAMTNFSAVYWTNIETKQAKLDSLTDALRLLTTEYDKSVKERDEKIAMNKARIAKIAELAK